MAGEILSYPLRQVGKIAEYFKKAGESLRENEEIRAELITLEKIKAENAALQKEVETLRAKLKMTAEIKYETIVANIVHDNSFMDKQSFIADNPDRAVSPGNVVVSNKGYLLGIVIEAVGGYAKIQSIRDGNSNIPVRIAGTDIFGFMQGGGNADPELRFLSDGAFVPEVGMFLITSGVNGNVPNNIPVGRIDRITDGGIKVQIGGELKNQESAVILLFDKNNRYGQ